MRDAGFEPAIKETRKRWNYLLTLLLRSWPELQGLRVFELHEQHGLHVHLITNQFIDVNRARELATQAGWGRIHVTRMPCELCSVEFTKPAKSGRGGLAKGDSLNGWQSRAGS